MHPAYPSLQPCAELPDLCNKPYLMYKKADVVISSFSITHSRKTQIDFSLPYATNSLVMANPSKVKVTSYADLAGKSIGVTRTGISDEELSRGTGDIQGVTIVRNNDDATTRDSIGNGDQPIVALAQSAIPSIKKAYPTRDIEVKFVMKTFPLAVGLRKNEPELKAYLDGWVKTNLQNGKLNTIFKKYHGASLQAEMLH